MIPNNLPISRIGRGHNIAKIFLLMGILTSAFIILLAYPDGRTGSTNNGCTCHGSQNSATSLSVTAQNGSFTVQPGSTSSYTITVSNSALNYFGIDIGVKTTSNGETNAGSLAASGNDMYASNGELTQSNTKMGNNSTTFAFSWTAPSTPGTYYIKSAGLAVNNDGSTSGDQWNLMTVRSITVAAANSISVTSPNGGENWCAGSTHNITWTSSGMTNVNISLSTDGGNTFTTSLATNVQAATGSWTWNIPTGQAVSTTYRVKVSDASDANTSDASNANFSVSPATSISSQPQSVTICSGQQVQFSVTATGSNLTYQWKKDGTNINGATSATLTINNVQSANAGSYTCTVAGACGNPIISNAATLTVNGTPQITSNPTAQSVCEGQSVTFSVTATGSQLTYQWRKDGAPITGAVNSTYSISAVTIADVGNYDVVVSGLCTPPATSTAAALAISTTVSITTQPQSITSCEGSSAFLFVTTSGSGAVFEWSKNGTAIANSNNDTLFFTSIALADSGTYNVKVTGCNQNITSNNAAVSVNPLASIISQPVSKTVTEGDSTGFSITASGSNLTYQWYQDNSPLSGQTSSSINLPVVQLSDAGSYKCVVTNTCGNKSSDVATLTVNPKNGGAVLTLAVTLYDFGSVKVSKRETHKFRGLIKNSGTSALTISDITFSGTNTNEFGLIRINLPITIEPNQTYDLIFWFRPASQGDKTVVVNFTSNSSSSPTLNLKGYGSKRHDEAHDDGDDDEGDEAHDEGDDDDDEGDDDDEIAGHVNFEPKEVNIRMDYHGNNSKAMFKIINNSTRNLTYNIDMSGNDALSFYLPENNQNIQLQPLQALDIVVAFSPTTQTTKYANLAISFNESGQMFNIPIVGEISAATEVGETNGNEAIIYPNPSKEEINIDLKSITSDIISLKIFDSEGRMIVTVPGNSINSNYTWNLSNSGDYKVANGVYRLVVETKNKVYSYSLVVAR